MAHASLIQNHIRAPLNELLGAPANIRLLRVLATEVSDAISAPMASKSAGLTEAGGRRALRRLTDTGFVERIGSGRSQQYRIRRDDSLIIQLVALFDAEQRRYHSLLFQLKQLLGGFPEVQVAWIDDWPGEIGQPLHIGVLADSNSLSYLASEIRRRIIDIESTFELLIEVHAFSPADLPEIDWLNAQILAGAPVVPNQQGKRHQSHAGLDARAAVMSKVIADMLDRDPSLLRRAQRHVAYLMEEEQGTASHDIREWNDILANYSRGRLKSFLVTDTPRAHRLRQSSPFFAVLSSDEREKLLDLVTQHDA